LVKTQRILAKNHKKGNKTREEPNGCSLADAIRLFVELLLERLTFSLRLLAMRKLALFQDTAFPPLFDEAKAVAHQLGESGRNTEQAYPGIEVADGRIEEE
jgi:hypothetical protein